MVYFHCKAYCVGYRPFPFFFTPPHFCPIILASLMCTTYTHHIPRSCSHQRLDCLFLNWSACTMYVNETSVDVHTHTQNLAIFVDLSIVVGQRLETK